MDSYIESQRLRQVDDDALTDLENLASSSPPSTATFVGTTKAVTTYPTAKNAFYAVTPVDVTGTEDEGAAATLTAPDSDSYELVYNIGSGIPPEGTAVECTFHPYHWVFQYDGPDDDS